MKSARLICLLILLVSIHVLAQSGQTLLGNQPNGHAIGQEQARWMLPNLSPLPIGVDDQHDFQTDKAARVQRRASPLSGLSFANAVAYSAGGYDAQFVAVADVNGDGKPDLLVATCGNNSFNSTCAQEGTVGVLLGNGDGTFQTAIPYGSGGVFANSVAVADVNGDGKPDLAVANYECVASKCYNGTVGVLLGNGDGTFQAAVPYGSGGYNATSVAVADVNGDGKPDLIVANQCASSSNCPGPGSVSVLLGNGDGTFQTAVSYTLAGAIWSSSVAVADVNGDGKPDLLVANECTNIPPTGSPCASNGVVSVLLGNGDGTFQTPVPYGSGDIGAESVAVADVNGDGKLDLLVANTCATMVQNVCTSDGFVGVLLGNGDGTFQTAVTYDSGGYGASSVAVADVNGDGKPDLAVANYGCDSNCYNGTVGVLLGNGDGTFQAAVVYGSGGFDAFGVAVADVNGDGKPDLLATNYVPNSSCFIGPGLPVQGPFVSPPRKSVQGRHVSGDQGDSCFGLVGVLLNTSTFPQGVNQPSGDYWPLAQGNTWVYSNATNDPNQTTTIQVLNNPTSWGCSGNAPQPNAAIEVEISKSDANTYWYPGKTWDLHWMLGNDPLGNLMPWGWWVWDYSQQQDAGQSADVQSLTPGFPPFLILPATVSSDQDAAMLGQFNPVTTPPYPAPCVSGTGSTGNWQVSWNNATVNTPAYNGNTIQSFVNSGQGSEEDQWYFARQIGLVEVNQDTFAGKPYTNPNPPFPPQLQLQSYSVIGFYGSAPAISPAKRTYLVAPVGTMIDYEWFANFNPAGQLSSYSAYYTVNSADDCGNSANTEYPWPTINSPSGTAQGTVAACQGMYQGVPTGHTYTLSYQVRDTSNNQYQAVLTLVVPAYETPAASLTANGGTTISANVGDEINFQWADTTGLGTSASSYYTVDQADNCGSAGYPTQNKWVANTLEESYLPAQVAPCQAGRTYTINYVVDNVGKDLQSTSTITVYVNPGTPSAQLSVTDLNTGQSCNQNNCLLAVTAGDTLSYQWQVTPWVWDAFWVLSNFYVNSPPDGCQITASATNPWPWVAYNYGGSFQGVVLGCQAGSTYTITYEVSGEDGVVASSSVQVQVE